MKSINFHIVTLFPEAFSSYIEESIIARARKDKLISISFYNPRDFAPVSAAQKKNDKPYRRVDDKPFGGGPGMVMQAEPVLKAIEKAQKVIEKKSVKSNLKAGTKNKKTLIVFLSPDGEQFNTDVAKTYASKFEHIIIVCGRYEGIDARVIEATKAQLVSVGPYVLTGGELPALIMIDCISRQIEGVLGNFDSREEERASSGLVYTRPASFKWKNKTYKVPEVLMSGNHKEIESWRNNTRKQK